MPLRLRPGLLAKGVRVLARISLLILAFVATLSPAFAEGEGEYPRIEAGTLSLAPGAKGNVEIRIVVPTGWHLYRDMVSVELLDPAGLVVGEPSLPPGLPVPDPANPAHTREQYELDAYVEVPVTAPAAPGRYEAAFEIRYQGCKGGICLMPRTEQVVAPVVVAPKERGAWGRDLLPGIGGLALGLLGGTPAWAEEGTSLYAGELRPAPAVDWSGLPDAAAVQALDVEGKPHPVLARLIADRATVRPGEPFRLGLHLTQAPGWHTYWRSPGDIGLPTEISWKLPQGATASPQAWPVPERFEFQGIVSYGYEPEVLFVTQVTLPAGTPAGALDLGAEASWLVCQTMCIPGDAALTLPVEVVDAGAPAGAPTAWAPLFDHYAARHPAAPLRVKAFAVEPALSASALHPEEHFQVAFQLTPTNGQKLKALQQAGPWPTFTPIVKGSWMIDETTITETPEGGLRVLLEAETFEADPLPTTDEVGGLFQIKVGEEWVRTEVVIPLPWVSAGATVVQSSSPLFATAGSGTPEAGPPKAGPPGAEGEAPPAQEGGLLGALALAFLGGALLNIMPCVLPVLTLKLYSLVEQQDIGDRGRRIAGAAYTGGIVASFLLLAGAVVILKSVLGINVGWGFQFQYPEYVGVLAAIVFVFGLSLFGVFEIPAIGANQAAKAGQGEGIAGYFLTGVFATLLATPCSAPFLGTGMGFAFSLPAHWVLVFFGVAGLGLASPFLLIAFVPALIRFLPRPGAWMEAFKQFMGFTLMATTIWLVDVLAAQTGSKSATGYLAFLCALAIGAWMFGRWGSMIESGRRQITFFGVWVLIGLVAGRQFLNFDFAPVARADTGETRTDLDFQEEIPWQAFTEARVASLSGKPVFVDFTADWCLSCKANEKAVLETDEVRGAMKELGIVPLKADWTRRDEVITTWLQRHGKAGVPFYLVIPADASAAHIALPEVLTTGLVVEALHKAAGGS